MALVHRINLNFQLFLGIHYYKYLQNIIRLKNTKVISKPQNKLNIWDCTSFNEMLKQRSLQAEKSVLIKLNSSVDYVQVENSCTKHGKISNLFYYYTKSNKMFLLIEYDKIGEAHSLMKSSKYKNISEYFHTHTPILIYQGNGTFQTNKSNFNLPEAYNYSHFTEKNLYTHYMRKLLGSCEDLSMQMELLYHELKMKDIDIRLRFFTARQISNCLSKLFANIKVVPFGSSVTGFGQLGCDLDLLCQNELSQSKEEPQVFLRLSPSIERRNQAEFLEIVSSILRVCIPGVISVRNIFRARVPIIKFINETTNMQCDFSNNNSTPLRMSHALYLYANFDKRVKPLVHIIRKWARIKKITKDHPGQWITNFSLTLLVIFYLQGKCILPPLRTLTRENKQDENKICWLKQWEMVQKNKKYNADSLYELLHGFFEYYSTLDFRKEAICVNTGSLIPKPNDSALYIRNPFELELNVSKNMNNVEMLRLLRTFEDASHLLSNSADNSVLIQLLSVESTKNSNNIDAAAHRAIPY